MQKSGWDVTNWADGGTGIVGNTPYGGTGNSRNEMPHVGIVDGVNRDQRRKGVGKSRSVTKYERHSYSRPFPFLFMSRPYFPDPILPRILSEFIPAIYLRVGITAIFGEMTQMRVCCERAEKRSLHFYCMYCPPFLAVVESTSLLMIDLYINVVADDRHIYDSEFSLSVTSNILNGELLVVV